MGTHKHSIYDTDPHFSIDPITRSVENLSETKVAIVQGDHNSERFTFECPRFVDGHDMSLCNVVQIHYLNMDQATRETYSGLYEVDDLQLSPEDENVVILSWLISGQATRYVGPLTFVVRFTCTIDGVVEYAWNTAIHQGYNVVAGINSGDDVVEDFADVLLAWEQELKANQIISMQQTQIGSGDGGTNIWTATFGDGRKSELKVLNGRKGNKGDKGEYGNPEALRRYGETVKGETVRLENVLPDPYKVKVTARSKNLLPYPYINATTTINGITFTSNGDGSIIANGTATGAALFWVQNLQLKEGVPYVLSSGVNSPLNTCSIRSLDAVSVFATTSTTPVQFIPQKTDTYLVCVRINPGETVNNLTFYPQLEEGETATEWTPYVDITAVKSRNLIPYPYSETTKTVNGITFTNKGDGGITINGTATDLTQFYLMVSDAFIHLRGACTISAQGAAYTGNNARIAVATYENGEAKYSGVLFGSQATYMFTESIQLRHLYVQIDKGATLANYTVYPMLNYGETALPFEKYFEPRPLNLKSCGKNLLPYPYYEKTKTVNGITFTDNGDGSVTANGTATGTAAFQLVRGFSIKAGQYTLSGCPVGGNKDTKFGLNFNDFEFATGGTPSFNAVWDVGNGNTAVISKDVKIFADIIIRTGYVANNLTFYPQIELGDTATEYEQYKGGWTHPATAQDGGGVILGTSIRPNVTITPDAPGVVLEAVFNDTYYVVDKLTAQVDEYASRFAEAEGDIDTYSREVRELSADIAQHKRIYVLTEEPTSLSPYEEGDLICIVEGST